MKAIATDEYGKVLPVQFREGMEFTVPVAPASNTYWRSITIRGQARVILSKEAREYKKSIAARGIFAPLTGPLSVHIKWYRARKAGDLDGRIKVLLDALNGVAYKDDSQIVRILAERFEDKANPRMEVCVEQVESA